MEATIIASLPYLNIVHLHPQILHISIAHIYKAVTIFATMLYLPTHHNCQKLLL